MAFLLSGLPLNDNRENFVGYNPFEAFYIFRGDEIPFLPQYSKQGL